MPKAKKKNSGNDKSSISIKFNSVLIETLQNETEKDKAFKQIFAFLFTATGLQETDVRHTELTGAFGNKIIKHEVKLSGKKGLKFLKIILSGLSFSTAEIDRHLSQNLRFSFKLDKQAAYQQQLKSTSSGGDCVQIIVKFAAHGRKELRREMVMKLLNEIKS
ncbi:MAG: RNA-binding domain-containing protein [Candidatus Hodarchaeales archaeon]|jgi:RNA binding exosome subunit